MKEVAIRSRRVVLPEGVGAATIVMREGKIVRLAEYDAARDAHDLGERYVLPGLVDSHVHINEPGRTEWEGFATGTRAAAAGGVTTIVDMPLNCLPETTTVAALEAKRAAAAGKTFVDWAAWGGAAADNQMHIEALARAGVRGYKCFLVYPGIDGFTMVDLQQLREAMPHIAKTGLPLLVHAELSGPLEAAAKKLHGEDWRRYATYLASRPDEAETEAIAQMIALCAEFGCRVHIVHLATAKALPMLRAARAKGLPITVETCPHYLYFAAEEIGDGATVYKCAPPIRNRANNDALWNALMVGEIDLVATDHSPCPPEMKQAGAGDFGKAWGGIAGLSVALPVIWTAALRHGMQAEAIALKIAQWMSAKPAELAGLESRKGKIAVGMDADLCVVDAEAEFALTKEQLHFRHAISPYVGQRLRGRVVETWLRGEPVYRGGEFFGEARGAELRG